MLRMKIVGSTLLKVSRAGQIIIICVFDKLKEGAPLLLSNIRTITFVIEETHIVIRTIQIELN